VVTLLPNCVEAVISIFATLKAGAIFVVLNPGTKPQKLNYVLNNCRAAALVTGNGTNGLDSSVGSETPHLHSVFLLGAAKEDVRSTLPDKQVIPLETVLNAAGNAETPPKKTIDIDLAALIYTSGSTGRPKGVMLTHLNIISAATSITSYLENTSEDIVLSVLPLAFDYGLYQLLMMFKVAGTLLLEDSFVFPALIVDQLIKEKITGFPIVPTIAAILLQMDLSSYSFHNLRYISNTAAALPMEHINKLRKLFPATRLYSMYGLTECKRVSYLPPEQLDLRPNSVGRGMPNEEVYLVDGTGHRVGPGVVGELVIRGSNVMKGYWELPEETDRCLKSGPVLGEKVLYSGDLFTSDEEGYLYFVGRKDDIIKTRGEKVSPREVEEAIYSLDGVAEVAVMGIPDPVLGSAIKAVVALRAGVQMTEHDVLRHCKSRLEDFMVPKLVRFMETLPKTESGKISKRAIIAGDRTAESVSVPGTAVYDPTMRG
jgi:acyl-CoA synthetase (AMP-forming)/AMP-acid ligase II